MTETSSDPGATTLAELPVGEGGVVVAVEAEADRDLRLRLLELGLLPGTAVDVTRVAPLGDPIELRLRGYALSIRRAEARRIRVDPRPSARGVG